MKIVAVDNYGRDNIADFLIAENIENQKHGEIMLEVLRKHFQGSDYYPMLKPDDYKLSKGMEDLV